MADYTVTVDLSAPVSTSKFRVGLNFIDKMLIGNAAAVSAGAAVMGSCTDLVSTHLYWFGPGNPWRTHTETESQMHWPNEAGQNSNMDSRFDLLVNNGCNIAVTIGLCPEWMQTNDLSRDGMNWQTQYQTVAPTVANFTNIAELTRRFLTHMRSRYSVNKVERVQLWNELKGFFSTSLNRWRYEDFTNLYNQCWTVVQNFNASLGAGEMRVLMGGPYFPTPTNQGPTPTPGHANYLVLSGGAYVDPRALDAALYWRDNALGFDFVCLDGCNQHPDDAMAWFNTQFPGVPVIWNEFYAGFFNASTDPPTNQKRMQLAINLIKCITSGVTSAYLWQPEARISDSGLFDDQWCWTSTSTSGGGVATDTATLLQQIRTWFPPGTPLYAATVTPNDGLITVLASAKKVLIVNNSAGSVTVDAF